MPGGDGRGPFSRGLGRGMGQGGIRGNSPGAGPSGNCVCPACGTKTAHQRGVPCSSLTCPKCGMKMVRGR